LEPLRVELAALAAALEQARAENDRLRALRADSIPPPVPVLPAKVVARDVAAWRDSALVARGSLRGISAGDWVTGRFFLNQGKAAGVAEGQAVLAEQGLLGRIEQVSPYMARVQLFSDVDSPRIEVRIGSRDGRSFKFVDYPCSLRGAGRGLMLIEGVDYRFVQGAEQPSDGPRRIRAGDLVFSAAGQLGLPSPMVVGRVRELAEDPMKRLVYTVTVEPIVRFGDLRDVYVIPLVPIVSHKP
jgi:cell shape-determining protein MreC